MPSNKPTKLAPTAPNNWFDPNDDLTFTWRNNVTQPYNVELQIRRNTYANSSVRWLAANGTLSTTYAVRPSYNSADDYATLPYGQLAAPDGGTIYYTDGYLWRVRTQSGANGPWSDWSDYALIQPWSSIGNGGALPYVDVGSIAATSPTTRVLVSYSAYTTPTAIYYSPIVALRIVQLKTGSGPVFDSGVMEVRINNGDTYDYSISEFTNVAGQQYTVRVSYLLEKLNTWRYAADRTFTAAPTLLSAPTITVTPSGSTITVSSDASLAGKTLLRHSLSRYHFADASERVIATGQGATLSYTDRTYPLNTQFLYRVALVATDGTTGQYSTTIRQVNDPNWYLLYGSNRLKVVTTAFSTDQPARSEYVEALGRDDLIASRIRSLGREGRLTFHVNSGDRTTTLNAVADVLASDSATYVVSPYGEVVTVKFLDYSLDELAGGDCSITIDFIESGSA